MNRMASATPTCATVPRVLRVRMIHLGYGSGRQAARLRERGDLRSPAAVADVTVATTVVATDLSLSGLRDTGNECRAGSEWGMGDGKRAMGNLWLAFQPSRSRWVSPCD